MDNFLKLLRQIGRIPDMLLEINNVLSKLGYEVKVIRVREVNIPFDTLDFPFDVGSDGPETVYEPKGTHPDTEKYGTVFDSATGAPATNESSELPGGDAMQQQEPTASATLKAGPRAFTIRSKVRPADKYRKHYVVSPQFKQHVRELRASDAVRQFIQDNVKKTFAPRVLFEAVKALELEGAIPASTFYTALGRLCKQDDIVRVEPGVYRATPKFKVRVNS